MTETTAKQCAVAVLVASVERRRRPEIPAKLKGRHHRYPLLMDDDDEYDLLELPTTATTPTPTTSKSSTFKSPFDRNRDDHRRWSFLTNVLATAIASLVVVVALQLNTLAQPST